MAFSPDGSKIASGSWDKTVVVWDSLTGERCVTLEGHSDSVSSVAFSPDGSKIASGSGDNTVVVWDSLTGERCVTLEGGPVLFSDAQDYVLRMAECSASPEAVTRFRLIDGHDRDPVMVEVTRRGVDKILGHVGAEGEIRARVSYDHFAHVHLEQSGGGQGRGRLLGDYVVAPVVSLWAGGAEFEEGDVKLVLPSNLSPDNDVSEVLRRAGVMTCRDGSECEWAEGEERREEVWSSRKAT